MTDDTDRRRSVPAAKPPAPVLAGYGTQVTSSDQPLNWCEQGARVVEACTDLVPDLVGIYAHGSAALGGFGPASDLDILVVVTGDVADWPALANRLLTNAGEPRPLELSVVEARACADPAPPWPYLLHVDSGEARYALDPGAGDPDLISHYAVARAAGIPLAGQPAVDVFGRVPRADLLNYLRTELRWGCEHADQRYAVLNACRASAYAVEGLLLSKIDGARWWLDHFGPAPLVDAALRAQAEGRDLGQCSQAAMEFVTQTTEALR